MVVAEPQAELVEVEARLGQVEIRGRRVLHQSEETVQVERRRLAVVVAVVEGLAVEVAGQRRWPLTLGRVEAVEVHSQQEPQQARQAGFSLETVK